MRGKKLSKHETQRRRAEMHFNFYTGVDTMKHRTLDAVIRAINTEESQHEFFDSASITEVTEVIAHKDTSYKTREELVKLLASQNATALLPFIEKNVSRTSCWRNLALLAIQWWKNDEIVPLLLKMWEGFFVETKHPDDDFVELDDFVENEPNQYELKHLRGGVVLKVAELLLKHGNETPCPWLFEQWTHTTDDIVKESITKMLSDVKYKPLVDYVLNQLEHGNGTMDIELPVIKAMGYMKLKEGVPLLFRHMMNNTRDGLMSSSDKKCWVTRDALLELPNDVVQPHILTLLKRGNPYSNWEGLCHVLWYIKKAKMVGVIPQLLEMINDPCGTGIHVMETIIQLERINK